MKQNNERVSEEHKEHPLNNNTTLTTEPHFHVANKKAGSSARMTVFVANQQQF